MAGELQELEIILRSESVRKENWFAGLATLASVAGGANGDVPRIQIKVTGVDDPDSTDPLYHITPQMRYLAYGRYVTKPGYGEQFEIRTFSLRQPYEKAGVIRYLQEAPGVGLATAKQLWDKFQGEAVRILREDPEAVSLALRGGFTLEKARLAAAFFWQQVAMEGCSIRMKPLMIGLPRETEKRAIKKYGNRAPDVIEHDPLKLLHVDFPGIGWAKADKLYKQLGLPQDRLKRQALAAAYELSTADGDTWKPAAFGEWAIRKHVGGTDLTNPRTLRNGKQVRLIDRALVIAERSKVIHRKQDQNQQQWLAYKDRAEAELEVAQRIVATMQEQPAWPAVGELAGATDHQLSAVHHATAGQVGCLVGGPGCGKTWLTAAMVKAIQQAIGVGGVGLCSLTNKAAGNMNTALEKYDVDARATSIHRMLGVKSVSGPSSFEFRHNATNPLPYRVILLDEAGMPAIPIFRDFLRAIAPGTALMFVGDICQLPPIEHGAALRDFLAAGLPRGLLTEPQRNAGAIVDACCDIRDGRPFRQSDVIDVDCLPPENFKVLNAFNPSQQIDIMLATIDQWKSVGFDPIWDAQVMCTVNEAGDVSRAKLNKLLQNNLNSSGVSCKGNPFRVGDKVACMDNGQFDLACSQTAGTSDNDQYPKDSGDDADQAFVAKSEFGRVLAVSEKTVTVQFEYPVRRVVFKGFAQQSSSAQPAAGSPAGEAFDSMPGIPLQLAYAATVHRMQGSEVKIGLPIIDESFGAKRIAGCEHFFTAMSRGKTLSLPIGKASTAQAMCRRKLLPLRKTFLKELIEEGLNGRPVVARNVAAAMEKRDTLISGSPQAAIEAALAELF